MEPWEVLSASIIAIREQGGVVLIKDKALNDRRGTVQDVTATSLAVSWKDGQSTPIALQSMDPARYEIWGRPS